MGKTPAGRPPRPNHAKALGIGLGALFLAAGLALIAGAVVPIVLDHLRESRIAAEGADAEGMVLVKRREEAGRLTVANASVPLFEYFVRYRFPVGGGQAEGTARVSRETWAALEEREAIAVRYLRDEAGTSRVEGQMPPTGGSAIVLAAVGAILAAVGGALLYGLARG